MIFTVANGGSRIRPITLDKLNNFVLTEEKPEPIYKSLTELHTADNFSIASNGHTAAIIYNSEDHSLHYTFGDSMDRIVSAVKYNHNRADEDYEITINRKTLLDAIKSQFKELKALVKLNGKITLHDFDMTTRITMDYKDYKMYIGTDSEYKDNYCCKYTITEQPEISIDFVEPRYGKKVESCTALYNTKYLIDLLNFMVGYDEITIHIGGGAVTSLRCEEVDREISIMPKGK